MDRCTANFDGNQGVQLADCSFKWRKLEVFIREDAVLGRAIGNAEGDAGLEVLLEGLEPRFALGLLKDMVEYGLESGVR